MKLFEIRDDDLNDKLVGYLMYYDRAEEFYIELPEGIDEADAPFMFARQTREKRYSVDKYWSRKWVDARIVPPDRQNIGEILKVNGLKTYDPFKLLELADGRCAQDESYIKKADSRQLPEWFFQRMKRKVKDIITPEKHTLVVFFEDGTTRRVNVDALKGADRLFGRILREPEVFSVADVMCGGNGVQWGTERFIPADILYTAGERIDFPFEYVQSFINTRVADTGEITDLMNVSRQYINRLVAYRRLMPVKQGKNNNLFLKSDVEKGI